MKTLLIAVLFLSGRTLVPTDVFPKPEWCWQRDAIQYRKEYKAEEKAVEEFNRTNNMYTK